ANNTVLSVLKGKAKVRSLKIDLVFCSKAFSPMESGHLRRAFRLALKKSRIEEFHFHDLRHTFATRLVQAGVELTRCSGF
ncbi:MAG TPA: tyrosine-type recombinase/integrase, partial [Nitrospiraceae bacterium]|nr:tyrosine-type recombinase/integrase [Nitrospiraceae bacterium]